MRVYGLLGLNPDLQFITRAGRPIRPWSTLAVVATALGIAAAIGALLIGVSFLNVPFDGYPVLGWIGAVGAAIGLVIAVLTVALQRPATPRAGKQIAGLLFLWPVSLFMLSAFGAVIVNAAFDRSPPKYVDVEVVEYWQETSEPDVLRPRQARRPDATGALRSR